MKNSTEAQPSSYTLRAANAHFVLTCMLVNAMLTVGAAAPNTGIDKHAEEQKFRALHMMDEHGQIPPDGLWRALQHRRQAVADSGPLAALHTFSANQQGSDRRGPHIAGIQTNGWTWLGPRNIGGRVRSILTHLTLTNILWCAGVDGGVWKSTNSGASWFPLDDFMANLAVACMVMDPTNADVIYAGTGDGFGAFDAVRGAGIFKTGDGGATWSQISVTTNSSFQYVNRLAIDPNNGQVILAATRSGIFRSEDGGGTWTRSYSTETLDLDFHPTDSSQCIASGYNGKAFYSTNGGVNWRTATGLPSVPSGCSGCLDGRVELTYSRSSPSTVFASVDNNQGEVYRSTDGGHSYLRRNTGTNYLGGAGWSNNAIWADPTSTNIIIVGGQPALWRSTDGGATLTRINQWFLNPMSPYVDHHVIVSSPAFDGTNVKTVYFGNDAGVFRAADVYGVSPASGWEELNHNLGITQFHGGAGNPESMVIIGGAQDNFTLRYTLRGGTGGWTRIAWGDGGFCAADQTDPNYFYGEFPYLQIHRSVNGGLFSDLSHPIYSGITEAGNAEVNFIAPFILDPNNPNTMLAGGLSLWRSTNVKAEKPSWSRIKNSTGSPISAIAVAPGNSDIIWVSQNNGFVAYATNGTAASPIWHRRDLGTPTLPKRYSGRIAIAPIDSSRVYVTFGGFSSGNVWRTSDSGITWTDISSNLPQAPVNSIVIAPWDPNTLYVGTEVGVYATTNNGTSWSTSNDGPANVVVSELFWLGNKLVAVTHGRGMFYATPIVGPASPVDLAVIGGSINGGNGNGSVDPDECNQLNLVVKNFGGSVASDITALLTTETPGVSVIRGYSRYANLAPDGMGTNSTPFLISTSPSFVCGTPVVVMLNLTFSAGTNTASFILPNTNNAYIITQSTGATIVPGDTDIGNHARNSLTTISLPFNYALYGQTFSNANICGSGNIQFLSGDFGIGCVPFSFFNYAILAFSDLLRTDTPGSGIFTSVSGSAPNRIFNIEWRATYITDFTGGPPNLDKGKPLNFEVRLYEDQPRFDIIYGELNGDGSTVGVGVQQDTGSAYTSFDCHKGGLSPGLQLTFQFQPTCTDGGGPCQPQDSLPLIVSPTLTGPDLTFSFQTVPDRSYVVQYKDSLDDSAWQTSQTISGDGSAKTFTTPVLAARQRFYRLSAR